MSFEIDKQMFQKDYGFFYLYKRADRKKPTWNVFIKLDDISSFTRKSLKTDDLFKAKEKAEALYKELSSAGTTKTILFSNVVKEYINLFKPDKQNQQRLDYPLMFWKNKNIALINEKDLSQFLVWRKHNGKKHTPKDITIHKEICLFNQLFKFAYDYIKNKLQFPKINFKKDKRPSFSNEEWNKIVCSLNEWIEIKNKKDRRSRIYLKTLILLIGNSGIRPGTEISNLQWTRES